MRGVVLAGGSGSRLLPLTKVTNKHLLPVWNKPMIYYPLETLRGMGITEILIVTGGDSSGDFLKLLGNGNEFGIKLYYAYQEGEGGIADALKLAEGFVDDSKYDSKFIVMLGDNIIRGSLLSFASNFKCQPSGAKILLKEVNDPSRFGVANITNGIITDIIEKPKDPISPYAVTGIYGYDRSVFDFIKTLKPSERGELEITDVNRYYMQQGKLTYEIWEDFWSDAGTFESLALASKYIKELYNG
jgi:glucose-1-phosphate thymidylyltransferase